MAFSSRLERLELPQTTSALLPLFWNPGGPNFTILQCAWTAAARRCGHAFVHIQDVSRYPAFLKRGTVQFKPSIINSY